MFKTIKDSSMVDFKEKKSQFITYAFHVTSQIEASEHLKQVKEKHWDATHHVYAYILKNNQIQKYSDDGEPHGTAGIHILNVLIKSQIYDILVVVVRYFGGILLGTGGLVRAYTKSCKLAIENAKIITVHLCQKILITFNYNLYNSIQKLLSNYHHKIVNQIFNNSISIEVVIHLASFDNLKSKLLELACGEISIQKLEQVEMSLS